VLDDLLRRQHGVLTRRQALAAGLSSATVRARLASGRWQRAGWGVYATFSGPLPRLAVLCAAQLAAGEVAVLSHESAAELVGLVDEPATAIHLTVPTGHHLRRRPGIVLHRSGRIEACRHPSRFPPQTRVEETVLDLVESVDSLDKALVWLTRACGRRLTNADRLVAALGARSRMRWRREVRAILGDVDAGAQSPLELSYLRDGYGAVAGITTTCTMRRSLCWWSWMAALGTRPTGASATYRGTTRATEAGAVVLRYGWADVVHRPCLVAGQVEKVLRRRGWLGRLRPCARCPP
jgi:hypothetical protein